MYRFLLRPSWLGALALALAAGVVMVFLGIWQLHRYEQRTAINDRIDGAYRAKYHGSSYLSPMIGARARSATVKVIPRNTGVWSSRGTRRR